LSARKIIANFADESSKPGVAWKWRLWQPRTTRKDGSAKSMTYQNQAWTI